MQHPQIRLPFQIELGVAAAIPRMEKGEISHMNLKCRRIVHKVIVVIAQASDHFDLAEVENLRLRPGKSTQSTFIHPVIVKEIVYYALNFIK